MSNVTTTQQQPTHAPERPARVPDGKTAIERAFDAHVNNGRTSCRNRAHWELKNTEAHRILVQRPAHAIVKDMQPYKKATCACEREALLEMSKRNYPGMPQTRYVAFGSDQVGIGEYKEGWPAKKVMPINYRLSPEESAVLQKDFSDWLFVTVRSDGHDHPVAHTSTMVATRNLIDKLPLGTKEQPYRVLDLYGNPSANEANNAREPLRKIDTNCFAWTAKDFGRKASKWGPPTASDGSRRYYDCDLRTIEGLDTAIPDVPRLSEYDAFVAVHTLYYFTPDNICSLVNKIGGKPFTAVMHLFKGGKSGTLNAGEQAWERFEQHGQRYVRQTNVKTGEQYSHFDNSWILESNIWAHSSSETAEMGGKTKVMQGSECMGWTVNQMCADTYRVDFYPIPSVCYAAELDQGARTTTGTSFVKVSQQKGKKSAAIKANSSVTVTVGDRSVDYNVPAAAVELFDAARVRMSGRPRVPSQFRDHNAWVKREIKGAMSKHPGVITADDLGPLVTASFWCDLEDDLERDGMDGIAKLAGAIRSDQLYMQGQVGALTGTFDKILDLASTALTAKSKVEAGTKVITAIRAMCKLNSK